MELKGVLSLISRITRNGGKVEKGGWGRLNFGWKNGKILWINVDKLRCFVENQAKKFSS
jgi:hypothetical protein